MRIAIISKASTLGGGGSLVASKLASLLRRDGHFCHHFRRDKEHGYAEYESNIFGNIENKVKWADHRTRKLGVQEMIPWEYFHLRSEIKRLRIDLIHVHDTTTAISPITLGKLAEKIPLVWTMHDYSPFTGGCIYPVGCEKFKLNCGECPQQDRWPVAGVFDLTAVNLRLKRWIHRKNLHFVSPSKFLKQEAIKAGIKDQNVSVIANSVDTDIFHPMDRVEAKNLLELDPQKFTILLLAFKVNSPFKGVDDALKVLASIKSEFQVLVVGKVNDLDKEKFSNLPCVFTGYVKSQEKLNLCYNASDIFLNCSKADNLPLVVLESLAAGTPVYGYATGGIPEMIVNGVTGKLVETGNWQKLLEIVCSRANNNGKVEERKNCRDSAINLFADKILLQRTLSLYQSMVTGKCAEDN